MKPSVGFFVAVAATVLLFFLPSLHADDPTTKPAQANNVPAAPTTARAAQESTDSMTIDVAWDGSGSQKNTYSRIECQHNTSTDDWGIAPGGDGWRMGSPWKDNQSAVYHWIRYRVSASFDGNSYGPAGDPSKWVYRGDHPPDAPDPTVK